MPTNTPNTKNINNKKVNEIAKQIQNLIEDEVSKQNTNQEYKERFESFMNNFDYYLHEARETLEDFKSQGLCANTIEAEGYLRAFLTIQSMVGNIYPQ